MSRPCTSGIVIIGAGPYGLSVAAHLRQHGLPFRIFGSPDVFSLWPEFQQRFVPDQLTRAPTPGGRGTRAVVQLRGVGSGPVLRRIGVSAQL